MGINVLSLFDGMSCGQIALERVGIEVDNYYASEIDEYAIKVAQGNYPHTIQLGDVNNWKKWKELPHLDLIIGGSPCQGFSFAGKQLAFNDPRSKLFFAFNDIRNHYKPFYFMLENNKMKLKYLNVITDYLGVEPVLIDSALVSAQSRSRYYWTDIPFEIPDDKGIRLQDVLEKGTAHRRKAKTVRVGGRGSKDRHEWDKADASGRTYTIRELERLQTVPEGYCKSVSLTQAYKMLGNGWTVDVIAHIFTGLLPEELRPVSNRFNWME